MYDFKYFSLEEMLHSDTAIAKRIENYPSFEVVYNIRELLMVLDGLRGSWGKPITVTSGFRCYELNKAVGGVATSAHQTGFAVDMQSGGDVQKFYDFCVNYMTSRNIRFDQLILERVGGNEWVHFSLRGRGGIQRGQTFGIDK